MQNKSSETDYQRLRLQEEISRLQRRTSKTGQLYELDGNSWNCIGQYPTLMVTYSMYRDERCSEVREKRILSQSPVDFITYSIYHKFELNEEQIEIVLQDDKAILEYAKKITDGRWPIGEANLLERKDATNLVEYFRNVMVFDNAESWPEAEQYIIENQHESIRYVESIRRRWPEFETRHFGENNDPDADLMIQYYIRAFNGERWLEQEEFMLKSRHVDTYITYTEAPWRKHMIHGREILSLEAALGMMVKLNTDVTDIVRNYAHLLEEPMYIMSFARILRCRFTSIQSPVERYQAMELEDILAKHPEYARQYANLFMDGHWPEAGLGDDDDPDGLGALFG